MTLAEKLKDDIRIKAFTKRSGVYYIYLNEGYYHSETLFKICSAPTQKELLADFEKVVERTEEENERLKAIVEIDKKANYYKDRIKEYSGRLQKVKSEVTRLNIELHGLEIEREDKENLLRYCTEQYEEILKGKEKLMK